MIKGDLIYLKEDYKDELTWLTLDCSIGYEAVSIKDESVTIFCWVNGNVIIPRESIDLNKTRKKKIDKLVK
jgi:hypothetical protein